MKHKHKKILEDSIKDAFDLRKRFGDFEIEATRQLLTEQLDLIKNIASIVIAIIGVGYLIDKIKVNLFSLLVFTISIAFLILFFSYIKEKIDEETRQIKKIKEYIQEKTDVLIKKAAEAIRMGDESIYFNYVKEEKEKGIKITKQMNYLGEVCLFLFYIILFLLVGVVIMEKINLSLISQLIFLLFILIISWQISFREWSVRLIKILSKEM